MSISYILNISLQPCSCVQGNFCIFGSLFALGQFLYVFLDFVPSLWLFSFSLGYFGRLLGDCFNQNIRSHWCNAALPCQNIHFSRDIHIDRGRLTVRLTSSLTSLEMYSKLDKTIQNITEKYISKLVKQEVSHVVILPPTRKRACFFVHTCR